MFSVKHLQSWSIPNIALERIYWNDTGELTHILVERHDFRRSSWCSQSVNWPPVGRRD